jgi:AraC family transcriptional regulator
MVSPQSRSPAQRQRQLIGRALAHVEAHIAEPLDAFVLADRAAMSRHHFHRVFQSHLGLGVAEYITWRRLQRACALLASGAEPVADIAWAVGYQSAQALAKAMRRELGATPTQVRRGQATVWTRLLQAARGLPEPQPLEGVNAMDPNRFVELPAGLVALTATARGMVGHNLSRAAQQAFGELGLAVSRAGWADRVRSRIALMPDDPQGADDPNCRYVAGVVFGLDLATQAGACVQPAFDLTGSLAWLPIAPGPYAVFTHIGPYTTMHETWAAIYRDWLPASGRRLRDVPPVELSVSDPMHTPPERLHTEIWLPVDPG